MLAQIYPDKIVTYLPRTQSYIGIQEATAKAFGLSAPVTRNLTRVRKSFELSENSKRTIKKSVMQLVSLSTPRLVALNTGKVIRNFRASFVTLTLPSSQDHTDVRIKSAVGTFFNWLRSRGVENYVWKSELQKNGNIHFHIVLDLFINVHELQRGWNRILSRLGYIESYSAKFRNMDLAAYAKHRNQAPSKVVDAFNRGVASDWSNPPTVDVKSISTASQAARYVSKYMAKPSGHAGNTDVSDSRALTFGKAWARSQSISRIKFHPVDGAEINGELQSLATLKQVYIVSEVFYSCYCYDLATLPAVLSSWISEFNASRAHSCGYVPGTFFLPTLSPS